MIIKTIPITVFEQNCRILFDPLAGKATVIDPGGDVPLILSHLRIEGGSTPVEVSSIVLTHAHLDHAGGVARLMRELSGAGQPKPRLLAHPLERLLRSSLTQQAMMFGLPPQDFENCPEPDELLEQGSIFEFAGNRFQVLFTPGHSPGHVSLYLPSGKFTLQELTPRGVNEQQFSGPILLAGDALFSGSIGRTDLPGGNAQLLLTSIREKLLTLPDETLVLSGHGENTTIGREKRTNPFLV